MLRGKQQQEQKSQIRCCVADELDKWLSDEQSEGAFGSYKVAHREDGKEKSYYETRHHLHGPVSSPPAGKLIVPARCQQLLTVGLSNKLQGKERKSESQGYTQGLQLINRNTVLSFKSQVLFKT